MRLAQAAGEEAVQVVAVRVAEAQEEEEVVVVVVVVVQEVVVRMEVVLAEAVVAPGLREWVLEASQPEELKVQASVQVPETEKVQATA